MKESANHYETLNLANGVDVSEEDLFRAYKEALFQTHPDKQNEGAEKTIGNIKEAYKVLKNEKQKKCYDKMILSEEAKIANTGLCIKLDDFFVDEGNEELWAPCFRCTGRFTCKIINAEPFKIMECSLCGSKCETKI